MRGKRELGREWETLVQEVFLEEGQSRDWKEGRRTSQDRDRKSSAASILPQTGFSKVNLGKPPVPSVVGTQAIAYRHEVAVKDEGNIITV